MRVPFISQMEKTECGAACLGMVLAYHKCHVPLTELREACAVSRDGVSALDIVKGAERYHLESSASRVDVDALDELVLPAIIHWELNHFVVLERLCKKDGGADIVDPAVGRRRVTRRDLETSFTGIALELSRGECFARRARSRRTLQASKELLRRTAAPVSIMMASAFGIEAIGLIFPAASALVVDFVVRPRQERFLPLLAIAFVIALGLRTAISLARDRILSGLQSRLNVELAASLVKHLLSLPTSFFSTRGVGDLLSRVTSLLIARDTFSRVFLAGFDLLVVGAYGALMLLFDARLGALVVALHVVLVFVTAFGGRYRLRSAMAARVIAMARTHSALIQAFAHPEVPKAFRAEDVLIGRYAVARASELNARVEGDRALELPKHALAIAEALSFALVLWLGGRAVIADRMTLGVLSSFLAVQTLLAAPALRIVSALRDLGDVWPMLDRIDDVLDSAPEEAGTFIPAQIEGALEFQDVSFRYSRKSPLLLDNVSFRVDAGERIAIAGASGAGKSTIVKLLLGFIRPTSGKILLDGRDLRDYNLDALRSSIGTVFAGGAFVDESVLDNVTLGAPDATSDQVHAALEAACASDVVAGLPRAALTRLGSGANSLSGGQRQRLLLTRALVKSPAMLLLDEASSALDHELERKVQSHLSRLRCTMVVVAHRLSAVAFADRILYLEKGKIVQDGSYSLLARQNGPFRDMVVAQ